MSLLEELENFGPDHRQRATDRDGPTGEGKYVSDAGDGDSHPCVLKGLSNLLVWREGGGVMGALDITQGLHDNKHVINANTLRNKEEV